MVDSRLGDIGGGFRSESSLSRKEKGRSFVDLRGIRVSLETSTQVIGQPGFHPTLKPGRRLLCVKMTALNSTEATIGGLNKLPLMTVTGEAGIRVRPLRDMIAASGVTGWGLAHYRTADEASMPFASLRPGGAFTYVYTYDLAANDEYHVALELASDRVARFDLP